MTDEAKTTILRLCPRCGGKPLKMDHRNLAFIVRCEDCGLQTGLERCAIDAEDEWRKLQGQSHA